MTTADKLRAAKALIEHCDWRAFLTTTDETPTGTIKALDDYFRQYAALGSPCPGCGSKVFGSNFAESLLATFRWGLVHGEGACCKCGWPATLYHFIKDSESKEIGVLRNVGLVYHPDFVTRREPAEKEETRE